jgi:hypothetical protein
MLKDLNPKVLRYLSGNHNLTVGASRPHVYSLGLHLYKSYGPTPLQRDAVAKKNMQGRRSVPICKKPLVSGVFGNSVLPVLPRRSTAKTCACRLIRNRMLYRPLLPRTAQHVITCL